jgi:hypothetical protein
VKIKAVDGDPETQAEFGQKGLATDDAGSWFPHHEFASKLPIA